MKRECTLRGRLRRWGGGGAILGWLFCCGWLSGSEIRLLNVSYDPTRELFSAYNPQFVEHYGRQTGQRVHVVQSHGGSGKQARSVIEGLRADVVTLALAYDVQMIADHKLIHRDWQTRLPNDAAPYTSTIVFLVRQGNPKGIRDWPDLVRADVQVITPNPKTSGGARWNLLAAWGFVTVGQGLGDQAAEEFVSRLYRRVPVLDSGARGAVTTFVQKETGDVCLTWENEAELAVKEYGANKLKVVYPSCSILAQPSVAVVDRNVDRRGSEVRRAAAEYLRYLYSEPMQDLIAQHGYRPSSASVLEKHRQRYPPLRLFSLREIAANWAAAQRRFFAEDALFDRLYRH